MGGTGLNLKLGGFSADTNFKYPWPVEPPFVPEANPTGCYHRAFKTDDMELPNDWQQSRRSTEDASSYALYLHDRPHIDRRQPWCLMRA